MSRRMKSAYRECRWCHVRILFVAHADPAQKMPPLNWSPDPAGKVAVTIADPRTGRFLAAGEQPAHGEHLYSVHECDGTRQHAQRGQTRRTG